MTFQDGFVAKLAAAYRHLCAGRPEPRGRSHAALLGGAEGVPADRGPRRGLHAVQDGGKPKRVDPLLLCCEVGKPNSYLLLNRYIKPNL